MIEKRTFPVFKTVTLGRYKGYEGYHKALEAAGFRVDSEDVLRWIPTAQTESEVDLVTPTTAELGFTADAYRADIYARAFEFGLQLCPTEVGLALRLAYPEQPRWNHLLIGAEPILAERLPWLVDVHNGFGGLCVGTYTGEGFPHGKLPRSSQWVFVQPRA